MKRMRHEFSGSERTLLIAGGTDGIGLAFLAAECERSKYNMIYVLGRDFTQVDNLAHVNNKIVKLQCDITDTDAMRKLLDDKISAGGVTDFVNTIGTFSRGVVAEVSDEDVTNHFQLNCVANINLIRAALPRLAASGGQILILTASLAVQARSPYALQSATKAALKSFVDALRIELKGKVRVMNLMPPSVDTRIFSKAGDERETSQYPPATRVADAMRFMLDCPPDVCIPELLLEQHCFDDKK